MATKRKRALALPSSVVATAETLARTERRSVEAIVSTALRTYAHTKRGKGNGAGGKKRPSRHVTPDLWETIAGPFRDLPPKLLRKLPRDGALNHDRYIYGRP